VKHETQVGLFILAGLAIFFYLSVNIKAFRFDKSQYNEYKTFFDDTGGVNVKSVVKIAGVDVGWVEAVRLLHGGKAELILRIDRRNKLAKNAFAMIHQDGLIGTKSVEIDPGDPSTGLLLPGSTLAMPGRTPTSVGELLEQFRSIATTVQDITSSVKTVFASREGEANMRKALDSVAKATDRLADFSQVLQKTMHNNEAHINNMIADFSQTLAAMKQVVPNVSDDIHVVSSAFDKNSTSIANDIHATGGKLGGAFEQIEETAIQARDTFRETSQIAEKINTGKGLVGKLINEDETYNDLKKTVRGVKDYVHKTQSLMLTIDMHGETLFRHNKSKGYLDIRLRPNNDCFYSFQLIPSEYGVIERSESFFERYDDKGNALVPSAMNLENADKLMYPSKVNKAKRLKNGMLYGLQFGKRFDRLAFRIGLFDSTFGVGCDFYVPLQTDKLHWITSIEAFDFQGVNRLNDDRPHIKWMNKAFFLKNLYTSFGVDDIYSRGSASMFWGGGIRFGDDDLKYFASMLPLKKS
jgi:phospholipid/cholesterol/gamma-HCH transport system substrate-binding protein